MGRIPVELNSLILIILTLSALQVSAANIDGYGRELSKYDWKGYVDYKNWSMDHAGLDRFIESLKNARLDSLSEDSSRALLINAYNAGMISLIIKNYPIESVLDIEPKVFGQKAIDIDGVLYSLDDIENNLLRKMGDNRIHFAIVCGSKGCPDLAVRPYSADSLDQQLDQAAKKYLSQEKGMSVEIDNGVVMLSSIFKWFGSDFGENTVEILNNLARYLPEDQAQYLRDNAGKVMVRYTHYDWSLNGD